MLSSATSTRVDLPPAWPVDPYADTAREATALRTWQRLAVAGGAASLGLGLVLMFWPGRTLAVVATALGVWLLVAGVLQLVQAVVPGESSGTSRTLSAVAGLLYLVAGVVCVRGLLASLEPLAIIVGTVWMTGGISEIISATTGGRGGWARLGATAAGGIGVIGGLTLAFWPGISLATIGWIAGLWLLGIGTVQVVLAVRASRPAP
jgi:uncharacterized membrane protein HdeD (DUF308 family)